VALVVTGDPLVWILLPTYNGAQFVGEQIASLQQQTVGDWRLLVRDDGSIDETVAIVDRLAASDSRIERLADAPVNGGVVANVSELMATAQHRGARRVMLADQDDVWLPQKIAVSLDLLQQAEAVDRDRPVLVHTDLTVVDDQLRVMAPSFLHYQRKRHEPVDPLAALLVTNFVTGCTTLFNERLLRLATPVPSATPMHDWWLAACAAAAGTLCFHPEPTVLYRQHGANTLRHKGYLRQLNPAHASWRRAWDRGNAVHAGAIAQARALLARLELAPDASVARSRVHTFIDACSDDTGPVARVRAAADLGIHAQYPLRTALIYLRILLGVGTTRLR
jgi:hypothetical protein